MALHRQVHYSRSSHNESIGTKAEKGENVWIVTTGCALLCGIMSFLAVGVITTLSILIVNQSDTCTAEVQLYKSDISGRTKSDLIDKCPRNTPPQARRLQDDKSDLMTQFNVLRKKYPYIEFNVTNLLSNEGKSVKDLKFDKGQKSIYQICEAGTSDTQITMQRLSASGRSYKGTLEAKVKLLGTLQMKFTIKLANTLTFDVLTTGKSGDQPAQFSMDITTGSTLDVKAGKKTFVGTIWKTIDPSKATFDMEYNDSSWKTKSSYDFTVFGTSIDRSAKWTNIELAGPNLTIVFKKNVDISKTLVYKCPASTTSVARPLQDSNRRLESTEATRKVVTLFGGGTCSGNGLEEVQTEDECVSILGDNFPHRMLIQVTAVSQPSGCNWHASSNDYEYISYTAPSASTTDTSPHTTRICLSTDPLYVTEVVSSSSPTFQPSSTLQDCPTTETGCNGVSGAYWHTDAEICVAIHTRSQANMHYDCNDIYTHLWSTSSHTCDRDEIMLDAILSKQMN